MSASNLSTEFVGRRWRVFRKAFWFGLLTVLTLGIYRFWMKTRLRRYYWSGTRPGGHPLEYVGDPLEKLLGFLIAVVILAFYIGIVNLILMFFSFSFFDGTTAAYAASFAGVIPLWFYARYRARRYVLARTRWRGIRFGVDPGAWGYTWRALLYWALTIASFGLLWPLMTHRLERFRINKTWYGDRRFVQCGSWLSLLPGALPALFLFWAILISAVYLATFDNPDLLPFELPDLLTNEDQVFGTILVCLVLLVIAAAFYSVRSFRVLTRTKRAGEVRFLSNAKTWRVIWIYNVGYFAALIVTLLLIAVLTGALVGVVVGMNPSIISSIQNDIISGDVADALAGLGPQVAGVLIYFLVFVAWGALVHMFVTMPLWQHYARTFEVLGADDIESVAQRVRDEHTEAEGFAEALDLGAAI